MVYNTYSVVYSYEEAPIKHTGRTLSNKIIFKHAGVSAKKIIHIFLVINDYDFILIFVIEFQSINKFNICECFVIICYWLKFLLTELKRLLCLRCGTFQFICTWINFNSKWKLLLYHFLLKKRRILILIWNDSNFWPA